MPARADGGLKVRAAGLEGLLIYGVGHRVGEIEISGAIDRDAEEELKPEAAVDWL